MEAGGCAIGDADGRHRRLRGERIFIHLVLVFFLSVATCVHVFLPFAQVSSLSCDLFRIRSGYSNKKISLQYSAGENRSRSSLCNCHNNATADLWTRKEGETFRDTFGFKLVFYSGLFVGSLAGGMVSYISSPRRASR